MEGLTFRYLNQVGAEAKLYNPYFKYLNLKQGSLYKRNEDKVGAGAMANDLSINKQLEVSGKRYNRLATINLPIVEKTFF